MNYEAEAAACRQRVEAALAQAIPTGIPDCTKHDSQRHPGYVFEYPRRRKSILPKLSVCITKNQTARFSKI